MTQSSLDWSTAEQLPPLCTTGGFPGILLAFNRMFNVSYDPFAVALTDVVRACTRWMRGREGWCLSGLEPKRINPETCRRDEWQKRHHTGLHTDIEGSGHTNSSSPPPYSAGIDHT
jgi:hypothetical protein